MSTAYLFPGLNGLLKQEDRERFRTLPEVTTRFKQAETSLKARLNISVNFKELLGQSTKDIYDIQNIGLAGAAIFCLQVGVVDRLKTKYPDPEWMMGCSLGDVSRSVCASAYDFDDAIINHVKYTGLLGCVDKIGANIGLSTTRDAPFTESDFKWFEEVAVDVSHLTPRFLNIGGRYSDLKKVNDRAQEKGWRAVPILNYPAHSRYLLPYINQLADSFHRDVEGKAPKINVFSSFSCRPLTTGNDITSEYFFSLSRTLHWGKAVVELVKKHGVTQYINIGPDKSLSRMMADIPVMVEMVEAEDLFNC